MPSYSQIGMDPMSLLGMSSGQQQQEEDVYGGANPVDQMLGFLGKSSQDRATQQSLSYNGAGGVNAAKYQNKIGQWLPLINEAAQKYGLDPALLAGVMMTESGGNAQAKSYAGAMGLMQVMPFHFKPGENPYDPKTNIYKGASILSSYIKQMGGNVNNGLMRYNGTYGKAAGTKYAAKVNGYYNEMKTTGGYNDAGASRPSSNAYQKAIENAMGRVGRDRYVNGAKVDLNDPDPRVTDCSSLVQWSFARAGIKLPRTAYLQWNATQRIQRGQLQPGDLIFFKDTYNARGQSGNTMNISHVGIYIGNGKMVNSTGSQGRGTVIQSIDTPFWTSHLAGFGRIGQGSGMSGGGAAAPIFDPFAPGTKSGSAASGGPTVGSGSGSYASPFAPGVSAGYKPPTS